MRRAMTVQALVAMLEEALRKPELRVSLIEQFQRAVLSTASKKEHGKEWDAFRDLAYDLEFYEPDPNLRLEDPSYFGDDMAEKEINSTLNKIRPQHT